MLQTIFTKFVLHSKLFISSVLIFISSVFGVPHNTVSTNSTPSSAPQTSFMSEEQPKVTSRPMNTLSYSDLHCPKVTKVVDNLGNSGKFKKGEVSQLKLTVTAKDPQDLPLYYRFESLGLENSDQYSVTTKNWSQDNFVDISVTNAIPGTRRYISVSIDNRDGYSCYSNYDVGETVFYDVTH